MIADMDGMPIAAVDYRQPVPFVSGGPSIVVWPFCSAGHALSVALSNGATADRCEQLSGSLDNGTHGLHYWPWPRTAPPRGRQPHIGVNAPQVLGS